MKSNYQDFARYQEVDLAIAGDGETSLPVLTEHVRHLLAEDRAPAYESRGKKLAAAKLAMTEQARSDATIGWDATPITTARMCAEVYAQIKDEDWSLVGNAIRNTWPLRLWSFDKCYSWNGASGGAGVGYNAPASVGAALANERYGRFTLAFGGDGDLMFVPSTLWTAAHHRIPLLYIVHNNRAYHQEYMYLTAMAARLRRRKRPYRHHDRKSERGLCHGGKGLWSSWGGADHGSEGARSCAQASDRRREERPPGAGRCRDRSTVRRTCREEICSFRRARPERPCTGRTRLGAEHAGRRY